MDKPLLVITVGLPRSGKSSWARLQTGSVIVCPDEVRRAMGVYPFVAQAEPMVWSTVKYMVKALFGAGHQRVILDATNMTERRRSEWRSDEWNVEFRWFDTHIDECIRRANEGGQTYLINVIRRMWSDFQWFGYTHELPYAKLPNGQQVDYHNDRPVGK